MRTWTSAPLVFLVAIALIVATTACLVHLGDDSVPDVCASLLAVIFGVTLAVSLRPTQSIVLARLDGYRPFSFDPVAPPPKA